MKAVLISGSFKEMKIERKIAEFISSNIKKNKIISFVSSDFEDYEFNDKFSKKLVDSFENNNLNLKKIYIIDSRKTKEEMVCDLKKSNIIFLLGGDTLKQINFINRYDLKDRINRDDAIIMGISAGAINLAKKVVLAKDEDDNIPELSIYSGIGVTDINIEPHCDFNNKKHWKELEEASLYSKIVVMHDDCFIIIEDNKCNYYGSYLILNKKEITYKNNKTTLQEFIKDINYEKQE